MAKQGPRGHHICAQSIAMNTSNVKRPKEKFRVDRAVGLGRRLTADDFEISIES
jgi:hypothetical protein